jgi:hypothetical protein
LLEQLAEEEWLQVTYYSQPVISVSVNVVVQEEEEMTVYWKLETSL